MTDQETRDIAIEARTLTKSHIDDCVQFRYQLAEAGKVTNGKIDALDDRMDKKSDALGEKINTLQIKAAYALGALIVIGKGAEILISWIHK